MDILNKIRLQLKNNIDQDYKNNVGRYFKEKIICYGVRTPIVRKIAKEYYQVIKSYKKNEVFDIVEKMLKNRYNEEATIAIQWLVLMEDKFSKKDFVIFTRWLNGYIDNWAKDDDFCIHIINPMIEKYPELVDKIKLWQKSKNIWVRRASAVSFITRRKSFYVVDHSLKDIFETAIVLFKDKEDLVQKGYGWMLKAASLYKQKEIFEFVMKYKKEMTRTALRYAIEKMPAQLRKQAMKID